MTKTAIIAGNGKLPKLLAEYLDDYIVVGLEGAVEDWINDHPHIYMNFNIIGKTLKYLKENDVKQLVLAGGLKRPNLSKIKPDMGSIKMIAKILAGSLGDNGLLSSVIKQLEKEGFKVVGADDILPFLVAGKGALGKIKPKNNKDIKVGVETLKKTGELDIGQSLVVEEGRIIGIEAAEGTNGLIARCGEYLNKDGGILIKLKKVGQDRRVDLPTIGIETIENIAHNGLKGVVIEAGNTLIIDKENVMKRADELGIFVYGVEL